MDKVLEERIRQIVREEIAAHQERQVKCIVTSIAEGKSIRPLSL